MKINLLPKTTLGKCAAWLSLIFVVSFLLKMVPGFPLPTFCIVAIGIVAFVIGIIAMIKKDIAIGSFFAILIGVGIIMVAVQLIISYMGAFKDFPVKETLTQEEVGKDTLKEMNLGLISQSKDSIYYVYKENLYKRKIDWTSKSKLSDDKINFIFLSKDRIFYRDMKSGSLYKINTDGSEKIKLSDDNIESLVVYGDWIYYSAKSINEKSSEQLLPFYKIKTDGSNKTQIVNIEFESANPKVIGDWIYYSEKGDLFKISTEGRDKTLVAEDAGIEYVYGDWIYYTIPIDEGKGLAKLNLCRVKLDGTEKSVITSISDVYSSYFDGDWIYFTSGPGMSRMKLDGTKTEKLNNVSVWGLMGVSGDWMYINDYMGPMFRVNLDGSVGTRIN